MTDDLENKYCPVCGKMHKYMMCEPIENETYKLLLEKLRDLWCEAGGEVWNRPEEYGFNENDKSEHGIEIDFDYGTPHKMYTPDGAYMILGSCMCGNTKKFMTTIEETFNVEIIVPKRDDSKVSEYEYQACRSGPVIRISENPKVFKWVSEND